MGIDCPEKSQDFGNVAKQFTSNLIFKKQVVVKQMDIDKYGRIVAKVYLLPDSTCLNEVLLKAGLAWHYKYYDKNPNWDILVEDAKRAQLGLWSLGNAIAPREFRRL